MGFCRIALYDVQTVLKVSERYQLSVSQNSLDAVFAPSDKSKEIVAVADMLEMSHITFRLSSFIIFWIAIVQVDLGKSCHSYIYFTNQQEAVVGHCAPLPWGGERRVRGREQLSDFIVVSHLLKSPKQIALGFFSLECKFHVQHCIRKFKQHATSWFEFNSLPCWLLKMLTWPQAF